MHKRPPTIAEAAAAYLARGFKPVPLDRGKKSNKRKTWQKQSYDPRQFNGNATSAPTSISCDEICSGSGTNAAGPTQDRVERKHLKSSRVKIRSLALRGIDPSLRTPRT
jgi:hypothetical protein